MTSLEKTAEKFRLRIRPDACGDPVVSGRNGHLYEDDGALMVCFTDDGRKKPFPSARRKESAVKRLEGRAEVTLDCDYEAILRLTDLSPETIRLTVAILGLKRRRVLSDEHRAKLAQVSAASRFQRATVLQGTL